MNFKHIDIQVGLKYLNGNQALYLKVLNNFLLRYNHIDFIALNHIGFQNLVHSIKGLSATLGMMSLAKISHQVYNNHTETYYLSFITELGNVIKELDTYFISHNGNHYLPTILILDDNKKSIDIIINTLDKSYDIIVARESNEALEIIQEEYISLSLLNVRVDKDAEFKLLKFFTKTATPIIFTIDNIKELHDIDISNYLTLPLKPLELLSEVENQLKGQKLL